MKINLTAIIVAKDEADKIKYCLTTLSWCQEILVIDNGSKDNTAQIAEDFGAKVISFKHFSFARLREEGLKRAKGDWLIYIDADERVTPTLAKEILVNLETGNYAALTLRRKNFFYGKFFAHGGWQQDRVTRVFAKDKLKGWYGKVHESPKFTGEEKVLQSYLIHLGHRSTQAGLKKSLNWTKTEAELLYQAKVSPVGFKTIVRKTLMEFWRRALLQRGYKDGPSGLIEALIQAFNKALIYIQVWELQQKPSLAKQYYRQELKLTKLWQQDKSVKQLVKQAG